MQVIGISFLLLAAYVLYESIKAIVQHTPPSPSLAGIILAGLSLSVMPMLVHFKRRVAAQLESGALEAESRQTEICAYLSAILLAGLGLNAWLGLWWADPIAGLTMVPLIAWEGVEAVRGRTCCAH
jgi:divalent metal cation (Fe/Co/Zn/Cd) transporter